MEPPNAEVCEVAELPKVDDAPNVAGLNKLFCEELAPNAELGVLGLVAAPLKLNALAEFVLVLGPLPNRFVDDVDPNALVVFAVPNPDVVLAPPNTLLLVVDVVVPPKAEFVLNNCPFTELDKELPVVFFASSMNFI
jgi:hypothetical protein